MSKTMRRPPTSIATDMGKPANAGSEIVFDTAVLVRTMDRLIASRLKDLESLRTVALELNAAGGNEALHRQLVALARSAREAFDDLQQSRHILVGLHKRASGGKVVASVDARSDMPNGAAFSTHLSEMLGRLAPAGTLSLVIIELGALHLIASEVSLAAANRVLKRFATILRRTVKRSDYVARIDTQQFAVIFEDILPEKAVSIALRIHEAVEAKLAPAGGQVTNVLSVTMGIAAAFGPGSSADDLLQKAQNAVVQARKEGRPAIYVA